MLHSNDASAVSPPENPQPEVRFADYPLLETIHEDLRAAGFERPTPIQAACIPAVLDGKDIIGLAQTGTGKTAAFALPIIHKLATRMELAALVLAPTRELAAQITTVFNQLGRTSGIRVATIVGGVHMDLDYKALHSWPNVLVATPGRLIDHLTTGTISLSEIEVLAIDEADRMHDMGFIPQIRRIMGRLPEDRQTLMFTATMDPDVEHIARSNMKDPLRIQIGHRGAPAHGAKQQLFQVSEEGKTDLLLHLLRTSNDGRFLVFLRTKRGVDRLARIVNARGFKCARIHGDREQCQRDEAMAGFRDGSCRILIATDIAARGIDIDDIEHVINYDFPRHSEDYVHRIGRTARMESLGLASSFITRADNRFVMDVKRLVGDKLPAAIPSPTGGGDEPANFDADHESSHRGARSGRGRSTRGGQRGGQRGGHSRTGGHGGHSTRSHAAAASGQAQPQQAQAQGQGEYVKAADTNGEQGPKKRRRRRGGKKSGGPAPTSKPSGEASA